MARSTAAGHAAIGTARAELEDERDFLLRSIADLDAERAVGDLSDDDHRALRDRYSARTAAVLRALEDLDDHRGSEPAPEPASSPAPPPSAKGAHPGPARRRRRSVLGWGALGAFAAAAVVLVVAELTTRLPGQTATGSLRLDSVQQLQRTLAQAQTLEAAGQADQALSLYRQILRKDPTQEQALAESGWLEFEAGVSARSASALSQGQHDEQSAEAADPGAYAPHLYLGSMLLVEDRPADAADEFARFLAAGPPTVVVQRAWPFVVRAYEGAGRTVPAPPPGVAP